MSYRPVYLKPKILDKSWDTSNSDINIEESVVSELNLDNLSPRSRLLLAPRLRTVDFDAISTDIFHNESIIAMNKTADTSRLIYQSDISLLELGLEV